MTRIRVRTPAAFAGFDRATVQQSGRGGCSCKRSAARKRWRASAKTARQARIEKARAARRANSTLRAGHVAPKRLVTLPKLAVTFRRSHRSRSTGMTGHDTPDSAVTMVRNRRSRCSGIPNSGSGRQQEGPPAMGQFEPHPNRAGAGGVDLRDAARPRERVHPCPRDGGKCAAEFHHRRRGVRRAPQGTRSSHHLRRDEPLGLIASMSVRVLSAMQVSGPATEKPAASEIATRVPRNRRKFSAHTAYLGDNYSDSGGGGPRWATTCVGEWVLSQSLRAAFMRVCQPRPVALKASTTSAS